MFTKKMSRKRIAFFLLLLFLFNLNFSRAADAGVNWTTGAVPAKGGTSDWRTVAMSSDGQKIAAVVYNGYVYTSTDGGASWKLRSEPGSRSWGSITCSGDGNKIAVAERGDSNYVYVSTDGGETWSYSQPTVGLIEDIAYSQDGSTLAVVDIGSANNGYPYISTNNGLTWTAQTNLPAGCWTNTAISADGLKIAMREYFTGNIYTSTNRGATWTTRSVPYVISNMAELINSADGNKIIATGEGSAGILASTDNGATWVTHNIVAGQYVYGAAMSSDGSKLYAGCANNYIYESSDFGVTWTQKTNAGNREWSSAGIACSSDGSKIVGVVDNGYIYTSIDYGDTWTERRGAGSLNTMGLTVSNDGSKLAWAGPGNNIYTSTDSGATWTEQTSSGSTYWYGLAASSDGTKLVAAVPGGYIYTSTDSGVSWNPCTSAGSRFWFKVAISEDGQKIAAANYNGYIYTSTDGGSSWVENSSSGSRYWFDIFSSSDGSKLSAVVNGGYLYVSTDGGANWAEKLNSTTLVWSSITGSNDGVKMYASAGGPNYIYASTDSGANWTQLTSAGNRAWSSISCSSDGVKLVAADATGYIYTSSDSGANWTSQTNSGIRQWGIAKISGNGNKIFAMASNSSTLYKSEGDLDLIAPTNPQPGSIHYIRKNQAQPPQINFTASTDSGGSGLAGYQYYWGTSSSGTGTAEITAANYTPSALSAYGKYYLRVRAKDNAGNFSDWQTVYTYDYTDKDDYTFYDLENVSINIEAIEEVRYERKISNEVVGYVSINIPDLGLNYYNNYFEDITIDRDAHDNPYVEVPSGSDLADAVNGHNKWVPIKLGPFTRAPVIKYSTDGLNFTNITKLDGTSITDNIRNYVYADNYVTFEVNHFSTYGTAVLDSVEFTAAQLLGTVSETKIITVNVKDDAGDGIQAAPVTFSIQSGAGQLNGGSGPVLVLTNADGVATINYTYPAVEGVINVVRAQVDTIFDTIQLEIPSSALTPAQVATYTAWKNAQVPSTIGGYDDDPDHDGVKNLLEWNYGVDSTSANIADTDSDGINDKYDAYPNNASLKVFDTVLNPEIQATENFTGVANNANIIAPSPNLKLIFGTHERLSTTDIIADDTKTVLKISGLAYETVRDGNLAFASTTYDLSRNIYKGLKPGETYSVFFSYINRGNATDSYLTTVNLVQAANRWSRNYSNSGLNNVAAWQAANLEVNVLPDSALAFERTTLNVEIGLPGNITAVSYNRFVNAYPNNTFANQGYYGGEQDFSYGFTLEAEGYNLSFLSRSVTINAPSNYTGTPVSETNLVPGAKLKYFIVVRNNNTSVATSVNVKDKIPNNCHLFYTDAPSVTGAASWAWQGATNNTADKDRVDAVKYEITIPARGTVTASYTVTVD